MPELGALSEKGAEATAARHHLQVRSLLALRRWWPSVTGSAPANQQQSSRPTRLRSSLCSSDTCLAPSSAGGDMVVQTRRRGQGTFCLPPASTETARLSSSSCKPEPHGPSPTAGSSSLSPLVSLPVLPPPSLFPSFHAC